MKRLQAKIAVLAALVGALGIVMITKTAAPWFGVLMIVVAIVALICTFWPTKADQEEGKMVGCINYETRGDELALYVDLEDLAADAGMPEDVVAGVRKSVNDKNKSRDYYFCEVYREDDDHYFLKRLILVRVDSFGNLMGLNVMLNGVSYEAVLGDDVCRNLEVYLDGEFMMRLALEDFSSLVKAFGEDVALCWPKVDEDLYEAFGD